MSYHFFKDAVTSGYDYKGFSGKKSRGEHLNILAKAFKWFKLYLSLRLGLST